jgi:transposase
MKKPAQHLIAEVPRRQARPELTIGIDLGDVWSHYCTLNQDGEVIDRGRFRTTAKGIGKWFTDLPPTRVAMEAGVHSIWISEQLHELGHEVIVANVRELRANRTVIARAIRSMPRSWPATRVSIRRSFGRFRIAPSSNRKLSP